jgi:hypothetical protein
VPRTPSGAEPHLRLALRLRPVLNEQRQPDAAGAKQLDKRNPVPTNGLRVHPHGVGLLDGARHADPDAEHIALIRAGRAEQLAQAVGDQGGDHRRIRARLGQWVVDRGQPLHAEIEELHLDAGLTDVDADHGGVARIHPQQHPWPAAVRLDQPGLGDQPVVDQLRGDVADRRGAQAEVRAELVAAERAVVEQRREHRRAVAPAQLADRGALLIHGRRPSREDRISLSTLAAPAGRATLSFRLKLRLNFVTRALLT